MQMLRKYITLKLLRKCSENSHSISTFRSGELVRILKINRWNFPRIFGEGLLRKFRHWYSILIKLILKCEKYQSTNFTLTMKMLTNVCILFNLLFSQVFCTVFYNVGVLMTTKLNSPFDLERCGPAVDLALEEVNENILKHHNIELKKVQARWEYEFWRSALNVSSKSKIDCIRKPENCEREFMKNSIFFLKLKKIYQKIV